MGLLGESVLRARSEALESGFLGVSSKKHLSALFLLSQQPVTPVWSGKAMENAQIPEKVCSLSEQGGSLCFLIPAKYTSYPCNCPWKVPISLVTYK